MEFRKLIKSSILPHHHGLEIGPSYSPILPKAEGYNVLTVDHTDADSLREKYSTQGVALEHIEEVDAIDDGGEFTLLDETGEGFDFIVASHVFEHLPDPIHFLQRCQRALKPDGRLIMMVPDRRYCFDYLRPVSTAGAMLEAYLASRQRHSPATLFDFHAYNARRGGAYVWVQQDDGPITVAGNAAAGYALATAVIDEYVDAHAWMFTPASFRLIVEDLRSLGLLTMGLHSCSESHDWEFMVELSPADAARSEDRLALALAALDEASVRPVPGRGQGDMLTGYDTRYPSAANAIDLLSPTWVAALPPETGITAGTIQLYDDHRILWMIEQLGDAWPPSDVLELGPLEASHTYTMLKQGAGAVLAIEGKKAAYLKCLVVKEILGLTGASFLLGDFTRFLAEDGRRWPLIVACGVLYHMTDPLSLLGHMAARTDRLFLWTHVFDATALPDGDPRARLFSHVEEVQFGGETYALHVRPYGDMSAAGFCGGPAEGPRWMEREELLALLGRLGFDDIRVAHEAPDHPQGPALSIMAQRTRRT